MWNVVVPQLQLVGQSLLPPGQGMVQISLAPSVAQSSPSGQAKVAPTPRRGAPFPGGVRADRRLPRDGAWESRAGSQWWHSGSPVDSGRNPAPP